MAYYILIPTQKVEQEARERNENVIDYLNRKTYSIPNDAGYDARRKDKFGFDYLQDIAIIRDDGSKIIIHEIVSDITSLKKVELLELGWNNEIVKNIQAYTDGLDFSKMQNDPAYLNCLANLLLSKDRINSKEQKARNFGLNEIYIGSVGWDNLDGVYRKVSQKTDDMMIYYILNAKEDLKIKKELIRQERLQKEKKSAMINSITNKLQTLSLEELATICDALEISMDDLNLYNYR